MRHRYHLPTDVEVLGDLRPAARHRLRALVPAALRDAVRAAAPEEVARPPAGTRQRLAPADGDVHVIPDYGGDRRFSLVADPSPSGAATPPAATPPAATPPAPMPTGDIPYPGAVTATSVTIVDTPAVVDYLRGELGRGPSIAVNAPILAIHRNVDFWGIEEVREYALTLAQGWKTRLAGRERVDVPATVDSLAKDFDDMMSAGFTRDFGVPLGGGLEEHFTSLLAGERDRLTKEAAGRHLKGQDLNNAVLDGLVAFRAKLRTKIESHVRGYASGWMRERREHLDFVTRQPPGLRPIGKFEPAIPAGVDVAEVVHEQLVRTQRELTEKETAAVLAQAKAALRKKPHDPLPELTEEQTAAAIAAAEARKLGADQVVKAVTAAAASAEARERVDVNESIAGSRVDRWDPTSAPVQIRTAEFVFVLSKLFYTKPFGVANYRGHGLGPWKDRGRSIDLTLPDTEPGGFFRPADAIEFALAIDATAQAMGIEWRALYNDASVAHAVNQRLGVQRIVEVANVFAGPPRNINWHGPLITHFHVDLAY
ncbi:hypothetical protein [Amycolatopsis sp. NPDC021455]|uniref:hypothetical protein n=1 Tax=Amycolatopsis sp. NPDC021455 TaxID=3154901 RepID=UPI00340433DF